MASTRKSKIDQALLKEGQSVLDLLSEKDPTALDALDAYIDSFSVWEKDWNSRVQQSASDKEMKRVGQEIAELHAEVLRSAGEMKDSIAASLRSLRKKGKGLIAYSDHLPKRISTIRTRKG